MNSTKQTLREIINYYRTTRQAGHTTLMVEGALGENCIVVVHNHFMKKVLEDTHGLNNSIILTLGEIENGKLKGMNRPIVFDNAALFILLSDCERRL